MVQLRRIERQLNHCPEVDGSDYSEFPPLGKDDYMSMEQEYREDSSLVHIFPFVRENDKGVWYIDIYIWDLMLYPDVFRRFVICSGYCLPETLEDGFFEYIRGDFVCLDEEQMERFNDSVIEHFPEWHYFNYPGYHAGQALEHLYYVSHKSGMREILYKADLNLIAYHLDEIPSCNLIGKTPEAIVGHGIPLPLLRIMNHPILIHNLFNEDAAFLCGKVYKKYSGYIERKYLSVGQWSYLNELYNNDGTFGGHSFVRALYNRLSVPNSEFVLDKYEEFLRLRDEISDIKKLGFPTPRDICNVVEKLQMIQDCRCGRYEVDGLIRDRKKQTEYEYSDDRFEIIMPDSALDICREGFSQGNCVMDYLEAHAMGKTTILFLRKKGRPGKSFVTMEVRDRTIKQVYGKHNSLPAKDVYVFLSSFAKARWLFYDPYTLIIGDEDAFDELECDEDVLDYAVEFRRRNYPCEGFGQRDEETYEQITLEELYPEMFETGRVDVE